MIRFSALQARVQLMVAAGALAIVAVALVVTGPSLVHLYDTTVATCAGHHDCSAATAAFTDTDGPLQVFSSLLLLLVPALIGMFWGAPLAAREFETGTFRLVWTQGVTRTRWMVTKFGFGVLVSMVVVGLLSLMVTWWSSLLDRVNGNIFNSLEFGVRDLTPIGYAAFAFALGLSAGLISRRVLPAMAIALAGFIAVREIVTGWIRPHLFAPLHAAVAIGASTPLGFDGTPTGLKLVTTTKGVLPNAWVLSNTIVDKAGHAPTVGFLNRACPFSQTTGQFDQRSCTANLAAKFHELVTYLPTTRYWPIQWTEMGIFLGLTLLLGGVCFWWIRRPIT